MKPDDRREFQRELTLTADMFRVPLSQDLIGEWWRILERLPMRAVSAAFQRARSECEHMPPVATVAKFAAAAGESRYHSGGAIAGVAETQRILEARDTCNFHRQIPDRPSPEVVWFCPVCAKLGPRRLRAAGDNDCEPIGSVLAKWGES